MKTVQGAIPKAAQAAEKRTKFSGWMVLFTVLCGAFLGLTVLKLGNPVILDSLVTGSVDALNRTDPGFAANPQFLAPTNESAGLMEAVYQPWSLIWGLWMLAGLAVVSVKVGNLRSKLPIWLMAAPVVWFGWQLLSGIQSEDASLTHVTLLHFAGVVTCLWIGWYALGHATNRDYFWCGVMAGFLLVLWQGFSQHYGGLEAVRKLFYELPNWRQFSPEAIKRFTSGRIYGTLIYPNALAGLILLLLPPLSVSLWNMSQRLRHILRAILVGLLLYMGMACLYWSGSKSGWLIALILGLVVLLHQPLPKRIKIVLVSVVMVLGLVGFCVKFSGYFARGATSVSARFDYWKAAWQTALNHPLLGSGPGTFSRPYRQLKAPESEMTRLVHNDYLEQASDSGWIGFIAYSALILGSLSYVYRYSSLRTNAAIFSIWLGLLGWSIQSLVEFGLYIPALAWPAFMLMGVLLRFAANNKGSCGSIKIDNPQPAN